MCAASAVEELEVDVHRQTIPAQSDRHPPLNHVEVQRLVAITRVRAVSDCAGQRRHVELRLNAGDRHLRGFDHSRRERALNDEEDVRVVRRALIARLHIGHHPGDQHPSAPGNVAPGHHHVVKLQDTARLKPNPERQRRSGLCAQHPAHRIAP